MYGLNVCGTPNAQAILATPPKIWSIMSMVLQRTKGGDDERVEDNEQRFLNRDGRK